MRLGHISLQKSKFRGIQLGFGCKLGGNHQISPNVMVLNPLKHHFAIKFAINRLVLGVNARFSGSDLLHQPQDRATVPSSPVRKPRLVCVASPSGFGRFAGGCV